MPGIGQGGAVEALAEVAVADTLERVSPAAPPLTLPLHVVFHDGAQRLTRRREQTSLLRDTSTPRG